MAEKVPYKSLELLAQEFRQLNGIGLNEPLNLKSLLKKARILTIYKPLSEHFSGMSIKIEDKDNTFRFMLVNCDHPIGKQHFTICHEIYHLYYQKGFKTAVSCTGLFDKKGNQEEYHADVFAGYLLLPEMGVWELIPDLERSKNKISIETVLTIEHFFGCSHTALLFRLLNMGIIDLGYKESLSKGVVSMARKLGYKTHLYEKGNENEVIGDYGLLAYKAWENGVISESSYMGLLKDLGVDISKLDDDFSNGEL